MKNEKQNKINKGEIKIYKPKKGGIEFRVRFEKETVWVTQADIVRLFGKDQSVISRHINNILKDEEVDEKSNMQKVHIANSDRPVIFYSLDIILAVGYRTNSKSATEFRKWATKVLKNYLIDGYALNQKRLLETKNNFNKLQETVLFLQKQAKKDLLKGQEIEILNLLADYSKTFSLLEKYDKRKLKKEKGIKSNFVLEYEKSLEIIKEVKKHILERREAGQIFGQEREKSLERIIRNIYQTFDKKELYFDIEDKAANLLYLIIKDHPFVDGNKRIASFLFVYFLDKNNYLYRKNGEKKINDNALTALALLIAESNPKEKDQMIILINQLLK